MSVISRELPAPKSWQLFESLAYDLYRRLWKTSDAEMHGRQGQPQSGVDVYGTDRIEGRFTGVQCKGKDGDLNTKLTEAELREEVAKARTFQPPLEVFVVVTTAPNDIEIQKIARKISADHKAIGLFEVRVTGWTTLRNLVADFPDLLVKYYQDLAPLDVVDQLAINAGQQALGFARQGDMMRSMKTMLADIRDAKDGGDQLAARVTEISKLINDGSPRAAIRALERLLADEGDVASDLARYRIHASLGNAYNALGELAQARAAFHLAYEAYPSFPNAQATYAIALVIEDKREEAHPLAQAAYQADPKSARNASVLIETFGPETPTDQIEALLDPEVIGAPEIQMHLALHSRLAGDGEGHRRHAEAALSLSPDDWRAKSALAEALIQPLTALEGIVVTHTVPEGHAADLERAVSLLRSAWDDLAKRDSSFQGRHVVANLISLLGLLGRDAEAEQVLDQGLALHPDYAPLMLFAARRFASNGDWKAAASALDRAPEEELSFDAYLLRTQVALQLGDAEAAMTWAEKLEGQAVEPDLPERGELVHAMKVRARVLGGSDRDALITASLELFPKSIVLRSVLFDDLSEDDPLRQRLVEEIRGAAGGDLTLRERVHAAETLFVSGHYSLAADLYEPLHSTADSFALQRRLRALHLSDQRAEARRLFERLTPELRASDPYVAIGVSIYERAGLLRPALKLVERALQLHDVLRNRLSWMQLLVRLGRTEPMIEWLRAVPDDIEGSPIELLGLAQLIDRYCGGDERALSFGYRALRQGYSQATIHLGFALALIVNGRSGDLPMLAPEEVVPGCGVVLRNDETGELLHRVIETGPSPAVERDEIAPEDSFSRRLLGRRVGDTLEVAKVGSEPQVLRVAEIQTRFLFAFRRTMRLFTTLFPDNPAFGSVTIDESKGDERFEEMFAMARQRAEQGKQLEAVYREGIPMAMLAKFSGASVFDVWDAVSRNPDLGVNAAAGIASEFEAGTTAVANRIAIVDPIAVYAWARMGLAPLILKVKDRLAVVQATIDALRLLVEERESERGRKMGTFGYDGQKYVLVENTDEYVAVQIDAARAALTLAEALPLVPAESDATLPEKISDFIGDLNPAFSDSLIAAMRPTHCLLADDVGLRAIAHEAGVAATWTQCLAQQAGLSAKTLSHPEYRQIVGALIDANYHFVQFGAPEILGELQDSGWQINARLRDFARLLTSATLDRDSVARLLAELLLECRTQAPDPAAAAAFAKGYIEVAGDLGRAEQARQDFRTARDYATAIQARRLNRAKLSARLLGTSSAVSPATLARPFAEAAIDDVGRLWARLREGGAKL